MNPNLIIFSHATYLGPSGATAAATYAFMTRGYKPPTQDRSIESDIVHNQNGKFKYVYDNGPGFKSWQPFAILCEDAFASILGATAGTQYARLEELWQHPGVLGMRAPEAVYGIHWAQNAREPAFRAFPVNSGDKMEWEVTVQFEEAV